jgi:hypothetical protein
MLTLIATLLLTQCPASSTAPQPGSCTYAQGTNPDPKCTPGETQTDAPVCGQAQASRCKPDAALRRAILAAYDVPGAGEIDHLVPLCLGGANTARNLWPQQRFKAKDRLEARLCREVCSGRLTLAAARLLVVDPRQWK